MYDWKEIALMYKEEANRLYDEFYEAFEHVSARVPHGLNKAEKVLKDSLRVSEKQLSFIESFEDIADMKGKTIVKEKRFEVSNIKGKEIAKEKRSEYGFFFSNENYLEEGEYEMIREMCSDIHDSEKFIYALIDKCAVFCVIKYLKGKNYVVVDDDVSKNKDNIVVISDKTSKRESTIKVVVSGMEFSGKTKPFNQKGICFSVPRQHIYLIDPGEPVKDKYIFANFDSKGKSLRLYALIKGKYLHEMLVDPLIERFVGKKACILQKEGYNSSEESPFSIDEMIQRN